jgi:predicted nucleic acid-binding protein
VIPHRIADFTAPTLQQMNDSVYDALVGATAKEHGLALATRDRRALDTYRALDVELELIGDR